MSNISFVNDTFAVGEGGAELETMEALGQQVWKSALAGRFRLKSKLRKMSSDFDFSRGQSSQFGGEKKERKKGVLECSHLG